MGVLDKLYFVNRPDTSLPGLQRDLFEYTKRARLTLDALRQEMIDLIAGTIAPPPTIGPETWGDSIRRRLLGLTGMDPEVSAFWWETFAGVGTGAVTDTFGERWTPVAGGGGTVTHKLSVRGGVAVVDQPSGGFGSCSLTWTAPTGIVQDAADERWGLAYRVRLVNTNGALGASHSASIGMIDRTLAGTNKAVLGYNGTLNATNLLMRIQGETPIVGPTIASFIGVTHEVIILQRPEGTRKLTQFYIDGELAGSNLRTTTLASDRVPYCDNTHGRWEIDDVAWLVGAGL